MHFKHLMLFFYRKGKNAAQTAKRHTLFMAMVLYLNELCGSGFARFKTVYLNFKNQERPGRLSTTDEDQIITVIKDNPRYTTHKLAEISNMSKSTISEHFVKFGYINRFDACLLYYLTAKYFWIAFPFATRSTNAMKRLLF